MKRPLVAFLLLLPAFLNAQDSILNSIQEEVRTFIASEMKSRKVAGLSIALVRNDSVIWAEGFGMADKEKMLPCTDSTVYRVGSVSKLITATAIMQLVEKGMVSLDDPITRIIPEFSIGSGGYDVSKVTLRRILCHKSGLPSDVFRGLFDPTPDPIDSILAYFKKEHLTNDPGTVISYSNPGFTLLGYVVQRVSGMPFEDYVQQNILMPLGMTTASFTLNESNRRLYSKGYEGGSELDEPALFELPAGLLHASVNDLAEFMRMALGKGKKQDAVILSENSMHEMFTTQCPAFSDFSTEVGLCWFLHGPESEWGWAGGAAEHGGDTYVYHAQLTLLPSIHTGVVVLTNSNKGAGAARSISKKILTLCAEKYDGKKAPEEKKDSELEFVKTSRDSLLKYEGTYTFGPDIMPFTAARNKLITKQGGLTLLMLPNNRNSFTPAVRLLGFIRIPLKNQAMLMVKDGNDMYLTAISQGDTMLAGKRIQSTTLHNGWKKMTGTYVADSSHQYSLFKEITLKEDDGILKIKASGWMNGGSMTLKTLSETEAVVVGIGRQTGYRLRINGNSIYFSGLDFSKKD